ncbi:MAG: DNA polymerase II large subunit [Methanomassiliicoccus sp.]|nr:DNA polymerase II large subunit [Methanomassiliicoccus sp.]
MEEYFKDLFSEADRCYGIARKARSRGLDPEVFVEIPRAEDLASRCEKLLEAWHVEGIAERIRELSKKHNREEVSLLIAKEMATQPAKTREESIDRAVRVGLAVLTEGILVAPLEGIAGVKIGRNGDGSEYLAISFAGPIRAAGGTGQALSVLIGDVVRREVGIGKYIPTESEVQRFKEEIPLYKQCQHLQYTPGNEEIEIIARSCPVCVDGEGTEDMEISGFRDLPRIETNKVRGGACLVIAEGMCLKAPKIQKHVRKLGIDGWEFIDEYLEWKKRHDDKGDDNKAKKIVPDAKFLKDMVAGRPVLAHPSRVGGFRLRYGRGRTTGLAALAIPPATMFALDDFLAVGTQIKIERPGKAGAVTPCDSIEGPILLLKNGDLVQANTAKEAKMYRPDIAELVDLGEVLLAYGEFMENNHILAPGAYAPEWYKVELRAKAGDLPEDWAEPSYERAKEISRTYGVPLHPRHNLFWYDVPLEELSALRVRVLAAGLWKEDGLHIPREPGTKHTLETLAALHRATPEEVIVEFYGRPLLEGLGLAVENGGIVARTPLEDPGEPEGAVFSSPTLRAVSRAMGIEVRARAVTRIGSRMARPEKAKERKMKPPPHALFPLGMSGGMQRLVSTAANEARVEAEMGLRQCPECGKNTFLCSCAECGAHTFTVNRPTPQRIDLNVLLSEAMARVGVAVAPEIKGVQGMISKNKTPEALEKGLLRAVHDIFVFKDGTIRFDMTDVPVTHFRPGEIGLSVEKAHALGYLRDVHNQEVTSADQVCELKVQDIIPSESCGDYFIRVADFIDDLLQKYYGLERFYNADNRGDLIGHLTIGLAPHTSGGILCRIIGYTHTNVGYGHPFFHAAKRRNADGDEDSVILLLDGLLNFSKQFLPDRRGGLMDAPLVLTTRLDPNEIDKEAHNIDVLWEYPLGFYQACMEYKHPKEIDSIMDQVAGRIGSALQYEGFGYTHDTRDISEGPEESAYKTLETMIDKMNAQLELARKIRAVDAKDVVYRVITKHFLPDMIGNLKSFSSQSLRCTKCGAKYRRIPLRGRCYCGNNLTLTVHEKSVKKYLEITKEISEKFELDAYTQQRIAIVEESMNSLFQSDKIKRCKLTDFM